MEMRGGRAMTFFDFVKSRRKKAVLFFLTGFFSGGILYYLCQQPAGDALAALEEDMEIWASGEQEFIRAFLFVLWERGKSFSVLWLAGYTKIYKAYICAFLVYAGLHSGFLLTFFVMVRGTRGILFWLASGCPQLIAFVPLYIYSFYCIFERRKDKMAPAFILIVMCFLIGCVLEARGNVPLMKWMYSQ